jgi:hypothetical protein
VPFRSLLSSVRLVRRSLRWPLLRLLTPGALGFVMVVGVMADALDLPGLARLLGGGGLLASAGWALGLLGGWALLHGRGLQALFFDGGPLHWLRRQPLSPAAWSLGLAGPLVGVCGPVALLGLLQHPERPVAGLLAWVLLGGVVALAAAGRRRPGVAGLWGAAAVVALAVGAARSLPPLLWLGSGLAVGVLAVSGPVYLRLARTPPRRPWLPRLPVWGRWGVLLRRDLLFALRCRPAGLALAVGLGPVVAVLGQGLLAGGAVPAAHNGRVLAALLVPAAATVATLLGAAAAAAPRAWDPPCWPISARERGLIAGTAAALGLLPSTLGLLVSAPLEAWPAVAAGAVGTAGAVGWVVARARSARLDLGSAVGLSLLAALHPVLGLAVGLLGLGLTVRGVARTRSRPWVDPRARA